MAANKKFRFGPLLLTTTLTTNLLNPPAATGGVNGGSSGMYIVLSHLRCLNRNTTTIVTPSLFLGASAANAAGTEVAFHGVPINPSGYIDAYFGSGLRLDVGDFLVGGCGTASALVLMGEGEIGVAG